MTVINLATQSINSLSLCLRFNGYALAIELVDRWYLRHSDTEYTTRSHDILVWLIDINLFKVVWYRLALVVHVYIYLVYAALSVRCI